MYKEHRHISSFRSIIKKGIILITIIFCLPFVALSQAGQWAWISGSNGPNQTGVYGTKGVADVNNVPGARWSSISWTDSSGDLWLFGGANLNDLWKFDGTNWTWVSGSNGTNQLGVYGTKGVADAANFPGARERSVSWIDSSDNLWLFGGYGYASTGSAGTLNDLWKFDGTNWTWISGSNTTNQYGSYGTLGVIDVANIPGARSQSVSWVDGSDNMWLFGGRGLVESGSNVDLNDLWKFDGTDWVWISGSKNGGQQGIYGTKGVADALNVPGARVEGSVWADDTGNLWLFGGYGLSEASQGPLNDLWKFNGANWTWVSGSNGVSETGVYGTRGISSSSNIPGARSYSVSFKDILGNLWLFGGDGYDKNGLSGELNDLWKFDGTNWVWISGSDIRYQWSIYGIKGVPDLSNVPGSRNYAISWSDLLGNMWLFGGGGYYTSGGSGTLNDLWKIENISSATDFTKFTLPEETEPAIIDAVNHTINLKVVYGTNVTSLVPSFILLNEGGAKVTGIEQSSGITPNDFSSPVIYVVIAEDGVSTQDWTISVDNSFSSVLDIDDNLYTTAKLGTQWWMLENLKTLTYNDGSEISSVWPSSSGAYTSYNNGDPYGVSYNWHAVNTAKVCPVGWKVPTDDEWKSLEIYLGMSQAEADLYRWRGNNEGGKLKESGTSHWVSPNTGATDEISFSALPGGIPGADETFSTVGEAGYWWAANEENSSEAWCRVLANTVGTISRDYFLKGNGFSIRCMREVNSESNILSFVFPEQTGSAIIDNVSHKVNIEVAYATDVSSLISNFTLSTGALAKVGVINQVSDTSSNNFTTPVIYTVTAEDNVTTQDWTITVTVSSDIQTSPRLFTWVKGSSTANQPGSYGLKGIADANNAPGSRSKVINWSDNIGDLWLFGGQGFDATGSGTYLNDLWKYDGENWTWVNGPSSADFPGVYGTKGTPSELNIPGARTSSMSWFDESTGNLWLFGGSGQDGVGAIGFMNDLWKFDGTNWTWISGSQNRNQNANYGIKGIEAASNVPGARFDGIMWGDSSGNLWFFGGDGYDSNGTHGFLNDLWKFDGTNWTWVGGSKDLNQYGIYGTKGVTNSTNGPGSRFVAKKWIDSSGNIWMFGGSGYGASGSSGLLNDLWKFDGVNWTWVSGSELILELGIYGTKGISSFFNVPGARAYTHTWIDKSDVLWLFGGSGLDINGTQGNLNDLWKFTGVSWIWIDGSDLVDQIGDYGVQGVPASSNIPEARGGGASWIDKSGNYWFLGGFSASGIKNDLWSYGCQLCTTDNDIRSFSIAEEIAPAIVDLTNHLVTVKMSKGTDVTSLTASFTLSFGANSKVNNIAQVSGSSANDFTNPVTYVVIAEDGSTTQDWTVTITKQNIAPIITSFSPSNGSIGTSVIINGTNFDPTPANNIVFFGATQASVSTATTTTLTVSVPTGATYQPITVLVNGLIAYSAAPFVVTFSGGGIIDASSFDTKVDYATGETPKSVSIGDLDGDGKADLAVVNWNSNTVSVFRNTSTSPGVISYATKVDYVTGANPTSVSIGDLDGDGRADLAVPNQGSNTVSIFRNTSTSPGAISYATKVDYTTGSSPTQVSIGDLDGDGRADLVVTNAGSITVSIFRNISITGGISYTTKVDYITGSGPYSVSIGDLDGDGKADLAVTNAGSSNTVSVIRNISTTGVISFAARVDYATGSDPYSVSIGDLDGDGKADLAVTSYGSNSVSLFRNTSTSPGTISYATKVDYMTETGPWSVSIGDLDGDGRADLAVSNISNNTVSVFRNTSNAPGVISYAAKVDYMTGTGPRIVSIGDLDGDGKADLAVVNNNINSVSILRNTIESTTDITAFNFTEQTGPAIIDDVNHIIDVEVSYATDVTSIISTFTLSTSATAKVGATTQVSGTTPNDFTNPVTYTITAGDAVTTQDWIVTVTIEPNVETDITSFSFTEQTGIAIIDDVNHTIDIEVLNGTNVASLISTFTLSIGASATINSIAQISGTTPNNFTNPIAYTITAEDGVTKQGWVITVTFSENPEISDAILPIIYTSGSSGEEASITIISNNPISAVSFKSKVITETSYNSQLLTSTTNTYSYSITESEIKDRGLEYFFLAENSKGNTVSTDTVLIRVEYSAINAPVIPGLAQGGKPEHWRMFSIPYELDNNSIETLIETSLGTYDITKWRMVHYENDALKFSEYKSGLSTIERSKGYWLNSKEEAIIHMGPSITPTATENNLSSISLQQGWNQIGNPYTFDIKWSDVLSFNSTGGVGGLRMFSGGTDLIDSDIMVAFGGAYVFADQSTTLEIPLSASTGGRIKQEEFENSWNVNLTVETGGYKNAISGLGMHPLASKSKDKYDGIRVPRFNNYIDITFEHPEYFASHFAKDIIPNQDNYVWQFEVASNIEESVRTITWNFGSNNPEMDLYLVDLTNNNVVNMGDLTTYSYQSDGVRKFKVIYGDEEFLSTQFKGENIGLGDAYPNPLDSKTTIPFSLFGAGEEYEVNLVIYSIQGVKVKTLINEPLKSGVYSVEWDAKDEFDLKVKGGIYIYSLQVIGKENQYLNRKKIIIR